MAQMAETGLLVVGSRPPSRLESRCGSALSTRLQGEETHNLETPKTPCFYKFRNASYEEELFGRLNTVDASDGYKQINGLTRSNKQTYSKELLADNLPSSRNQDAGRSALTSDRPPSVINRTQPKRNDPKTRNAQTSRTSNIRYTAPSTHNPSYVDETLFGPPPDEASFPAPWEKPFHRKPPIFVFDCTDYRKKLAKNSQNQTHNHTGQSSEQGHRLNSRPASAKPRYRPPTVVHRDSYVDETLFGDGLYKSEWPAPWEKKEVRNKPLLFDACDYKVTVKHKDNSTLSETNKKEAQGKQINSTGHNKKFSPH